MRKPFNNPTRKYVSFPFHLRGHSVSQASNHPPNNHQQFISRVILVHPHNLVGISDYTPVTLPVAASSALILLLHLHPPPLLPVQNNTNKLTHPFPCSSATFLLILRAYFSFPLPQRFFRHDDDYKSDNKGSGGCTAHHCVIRSVAAAK